MTTGGSSRGALVVLLTALPVFAQDEVATSSDDLDARIEKALDERLGDKEPLTYTLHGGAYIWHFQPFTDGGDALTEIYAAYLLLDAEYEDVGFHFQPRFRDSKLRPFFESSVWIQEAYAHWSPDELGGATLKAGKLYNRLGKLWDGTFFGNVLYFDGLKLDPDVGVALEGTRALTDALDGEFALQYFPSDGNTNGSLQDRDTLSIPGGRQRDQAVVRLGALAHLGEATDLTVGASGQRFRAELGPGAGTDDVVRVGVDAQLDHGPWTVFAEYVQQHGQTVVDFPAIGMPSEDNDYWWAGVERRCGDLTGRVVWSTVRYDDVDIRETNLLPGLVYTLNENLVLMLEYDYWDRDESNGDTLVLDRSLNFIVDVRF